MNTSLRCALLGGLLVLAAPRPVDAASCIPGFDYAIFADGSIQIQGDADTDAYDSSVGPYGGTNAVCSGASIGTNTTNSGGVQIQGTSTTVCGNAIIGAGGNTNTTIQQTGSSVITGSKTAQTTNTPLPGITTWPTLPAGTPASPDFQNVNAVLAPYFSYQDVKCKQGSLTLEAGTYVVKSLTLESGCELRVGSSPIEIYFTSNLSMQGGTVVNSSNIPGNLLFFGAKNPPQTMNATQVLVQGGASAAFAVYAPAADCQVQGNADVYGALVCKSMQLQGNGKVHYDKALASLDGGGFSCVKTEISRASPVVALITPASGSPAVSIVQGSFEAPSATRKTITNLASVASFTFPYIKGHMRARTVASIDTSESSFSSGTILFDVGETGKIPPPSFSGCTSYDGTCRQIFTNTNAAAADGRTFHPTTVTLSDATAATVGALIAPTSAVTGILSSHWRTIVRTVMRGKLGGVDRSTAAVIQASSIAGVGTRPTIVYFGGTDGMLHAACASVGGRTPSHPSSDICDALGVEIWAFLPRVQLPLIRTNTARIDGSVRVTDVFGDFTNDPATGTKSWRTILTFQTGFGVGATPATYALDVTDPAAPVLLWEVTTPSSPGSTELGVGLAVSAGPVRIGGQLKNLAVVQTNNGGSGGAGVVVTALSQETGAVQWEFSYLYPTVATTYRATVDTPHPVGGIPGGTVPVDLTQQGTYTDFVFGDLFGNLWRVNAVDGTSRNGADTPLFSFTTNRHPIGAPPAIYSNGTNLFAAFASGGYVHPTAADWTTSTQYVIAARLSGTGPTIDEGTAACSTCALSVNTTLSTDFKGFAQALVVGSQLFVTSDSSDVNSSTFGTTGTASGELATFDLTADNPTATVLQVFSGAATVAYSAASDKLYSSSSTKQKDLSTTATTTGESVDLESLKPVIRSLWLRSE